MVIPSHASSRSGGGVALPAEDQPGLELRARGGGQAAARKVAASSAEIRSGALAQPSWMTANLPAAVQRWLMSLARAAGDDAAVLLSRSAAERPPSAGAFRQQFFGDMST